MAILDGKLFTEHTIESPRLLKNGGHIIFERIDYMIVNIRGPRNLTPRDPKSHPTKRFIIPTQKKPPESGASQNGRRSKTNLGFKKSYEYRMK